MKVLLLFFALFCAAEARASRFVFGNTRRFIQRIGKNLVPVLIEQIERNGLSADFNVFFFQLHAAVFKAVFDEIDNILLDFRIAAFFDDRAVGIAFVRQIPQSPEFGTAVNIRFHSVKPADAGRPSLCGAKQRKKTASNRRG